MISDQITIPYLNDTLSLCTQPHVLDKHPTQTLSPIHVYALKEKQVERQSDEEILGKGGMGIVFRQEQQLPKRSVAVKRLIRETPYMRRALIREADLMGRLEHPNIPPIHGVQQDPPQVVMKLIAGKDFSQILKGEAQRGSGLRFSLNVLIQISYALEYAHEKGIIHRDIKPENIMIGRFNEVYLMDWGISFELTKVASLPRGLSGTPVYMAPEMLCEDPRLLGTHTDIYLIGALLHEILTGIPRHAGTTLDEVLHSASKSLSHKFSSDVPQELAQICNRCCARSIEDRYENIIVLREAILVFLRHADALSLANAAEKKRTELMTLVEEYKRDESMDSKLYSLAAQAKFGFEQALQSWNACPIAQKGLRSISILMIERSIRVGDLERARVMIDELSEPNEQLERLFLLQQEEVRAEEKKIQILDRLAENLNPQISFDTRFWIQASLSTSILIVIVLLKLVGFQFGTAHTHERMLHTILLVFLPSWLVILYHYKRIMQNAFGRQALRTVALGSFGFVLERIMVYKGEIPIATAYSLDIIIVSLALANAAPAIRLGPKLSIGGLFLGGLSIIFSDYSEHFMYFVTVSVAVIISWDWHSEGKEGKRKENLYQ